MTNTLVANQAHLISGFFPVGTHATPFLENPDGTLLLLTKQASPARTFVSTINPMTGAVAVIFVGLVTSDEPDMLIDSAGDLHVAYGGGGGPMFYVKGTKGVGFPTPYTFSAPLILFPGKNGFFPHLSVDSSDYVVFTATLIEPPPTTFVTAVAWRNPSTGVWTENVTRVTSGAIPLMTDHVIDPFTIDILLITSPSVTGGGNTRFRLDFNGGPDATRWDVLLGGNDDDTFDSAAFAARLTSRMLVDPAQPTLDVSLIALSTPSPAVVDIFEARMDAWATDDETTILAADDTILSFFGQTSFDPVTGQIALIYARNVAQRIHLRFRSPGALTWSQPFLVPDVQGVFTNSSQIQVWIAPTFGDNQNPGTSRVWIAIISSTPPAGLAVLQVEIEETFPTPDPIQSVGLNFNPDIEVENG